MTPALAGRFCLIFGIFLASLWAQQAQLRVVIVEGEGALNNTAGRAANRDVVVEVQGADGRPVAGAMVTFNLPLTGASGTFAGGERTLTITTAADGRATAGGIRPNNVTGPLQIRVAATYQDQTATAVINQTNVAVAVAEEPKPAPAPSTTTSQPPPAPKKGMSKAAKVILILAIAGGAAAGAGIALTRNGSSNGGGGGGAPPIVITPGTPGVGGP